MARATRLPVESYPVVENVPGTVLCLKLWEDVLYVGTADGFVLQYALEKDVSLNGKVIYQGSLVERYAVAKDVHHTRKPVEQMVVLGDVDLVLIMANQNVSIHRRSDLKFLGFVALAKGAGRMCHKWENEHHFLCVAARRKLHLLQLIGTTFKKFKSFTIPEPPIDMIWCEQTICLGYSIEYNLLKIDTGSIIELSPVERGTEPIVTWLPSREFLRAQGLEGIFCNLSGTATRPSLRWTATPSALGKCANYVVALLPETVEIHDPIDDSPPQSMTFSQGKVLTDDGQRVFFASDSQIACLVPDTYHKQEIDEEWREEMRQRIDDADFTHGYLVSILSSNTHPLGQAVKRFASKFVILFDQHPTGDQLPEKADLLFSKAVEEMHSFMGRLYRTIMANFPELNTQRLRPRVMKALEAVIFPRLYRTLFALFKRKYMTEDNKYHEKLRQFKTITPSEMGIPPKFSLTTSDLTRLKVESSKTPSSWLGESKNVDVAWWRDRMESATQGKPQEDVAPESENTSPTHTPCMVASARSGDDVHEARGELSPRSVVSAHSDVEAGGNTTVPTRDNTPLAFDVQMHQGNHGTNGGESEGVEAHHFRGDLRDFRPDMKLFQMHASDAELMLAPETIAPATQEYYLRVSTHEDTLLRHTIRDDMVIHYNSATRSAVWLAQGTMWMFHFQDTPSYRRFKDVLRRFLTEVSKNPRRLSQMGTRSTSTRPMDLSGLPSRPTFERIREVAPPSPVPPLKADNPEPYARAIDICRKLHTFEPPQEKINCLAETFQTICDCVLEFWEGILDEDKLMIGGDDILPIFTFVLMKARVPNIHAEKHFLNEFYVDQASMLGAAGYHTATLEVALEIINQLGEVDHPEEK